MAVPDSWMWCQRCERVWRRSQWMAKNGWCPGSDCDGALLRDGWPWYVVRCTSSTYPRTPKVGVRYALWLGRSMALVGESEVKGDGS
jgi:hypothetical protein